MQIPKYVLWMEHLGVHNSLITTSSFPELLRISTKLQTRIETEYVRAKLWIEGEHLFWPVCGFTNEEAAQLCIGKGLSLAQ